MNMCDVILPCQNQTLSQTKKAKSITYFRLKQLQNHSFRAAHTHAYSEFLIKPSLTFKVISVLIKSTCGILRTAHVRFVERVT